MIRPMDTKVCLVLVPSELRLSWYSTELGAVIHAYQKAGMTEQDAAASSPRQDPALV